MDAVAKTIIGVDNARRKTKLISTGVRWPYGNEGSSHTNKVALPPVGGRYKGVPENFAATILKWRPFWISGEKELYE